MKKILIGMAALMILMHPSAITAATPTNDDAQKVTSADATGKTAAGAIPDKYLGQQSVTKDNDSKPLALNVTKNTISLDNQTYKVLTVIAETRMVSAPRITNLEKQHLADPPSYKESWYEIVAYSPADNSIWKFSTSDSHGPVTVEHYVSNGTVWLKLPGDANEFSFSMNTK